MRQLARYLSGMPGRKNLIWFTGSFPLQFPAFPDSQAFPPHPGEAIRPQSYDLEPELKAATDLLARAHVAVYPIDGRGLEALPPPIGFKGKNSRPGARPSTTPMASWRRWSRHSTMARTTTR
jgi:hypothetical protein